MLPQHGTSVSHICSCQLDECVPGLLTCVSAKTDCSREHWKLLGSLVFCVAWEGPNFCPPKPTLHCQTHYLAPVLVVGNVGTPPSLPRTNNRPNGVLLKMVDSLVIGISRENHKPYHPRATDGAEVPHRLAQHGHQAGPRFVRDVLLVLSTGTQKDDDCPKDLMNVEP